MDDIAPAESVAPVETSTTPVETAQETSTTEVPNNWYDALAEDLRGNQNITKYKSMEDMARGHVNAVTMIGRDKIPMPKSDAEFMDVYKMLGAPETAMDYAINLPENSKIPVEAYSPEERSKDLEEFKQVAHAAGLSNKQASFIYSKIVADQEQSFDRANLRTEVEMARCGDMMNQAWGEAKDINLTIAKRAMSKYFGPDMAQEIEKTNLGRNFNFLQGLYHLGSNNLEELGIDKKGNSARTPDQLYAELHKLQTHEAYFDANHADHKLVNEQALRIHERLANN